MHAAITTYQARSAHQYNRSVILPGITNYFLIDLNPALQEVNIVGTINLIKSLWIRNLCLYP